MSSTVTEHLAILWPRDFDAHGATKFLIPRSCLHISCRASSAFVAKNYPTLKQLNPSFPILIRESSNAVPMLFARYGAIANASLSALATVLSCSVHSIWSDFGVEKSVNLSQLSEAEIVQRLEGLVKEAASMPKSPESAKPAFVDIL